MLKKIFNLIKTNILWFFVGGTVLAATVLPGNPNPIKDIEKLESDYFASSGKYEFIKEGDSRLPAKSFVHEYLTPKGDKGYQVFWEDDNGVYSKGYGVEAKSRTWTRQKEQLIASSTPVAYWKSFFASVFPTAYALTSNTYSTDLESGSSQYWNITDASQTGLDLSGDFAISLFYQPESQPGNFETHEFVDKYASAGNDGAYTFGYLNVSGTKKLDLNLYNDANPSNNHPYRINQTFNDATWYHVAVSYDITGETATLYVGGSSIGTVTDTTQDNIHNSAGDFVIGTRPGTPGTYLDGLIDDVRIWSRELTGTEVSDLKNNPCTFDNGANLQGWWLFDNSGLDETANNNDLTNNNSATFSSTHAYDCPTTVSVDDTYFELLE